MSICNALSARAFVPRTSYQGDAINREPLISRHGFQDDDAEADRIARQWRANTLQRNSTASLMGGRKFR